MQRYSVGHIFLFFTIFFVASCATQTGTGIGLDHDAPRWQGRMTVKVHANPPQGFAADFDLQGDAQTGKLVFFTPIGTTAVQLQWSAQGAQLRSGGEPQYFDSIDGLTAHTTGAVLPIAKLFLWLNGKNVTDPSWEVDLTDLAEGLIRAKRQPPDIPVELKITLDR